MSLVEMMKSAGCRHPVYGAHLPGSGSCWFGGSRCRMMLMLGPDSMYPRQGVVVAC